VYFTAQRLFFCMAFVTAFRNALYASAIYPTATLSIHPPVDLSIVPMHCVEMSKKNTAETFFTAVTLTPDIAAKFRLGHSQRCMQVSILKIAISGHLWNP